jgi:excisionase family DNA binding protein
MTAAADSQHSEPPRLYRITDAMQVLRMSRTVIYEQIRSGRLRTVKQGRSRLITAAAIHDYIALLEHEAAEGDPRGRVA